MRKLLLLTPLFLVGCVTVNSGISKNGAKQENVSYICDQPHETVGGYNIGCPLDTRGMVQKQSNDANIEIFTKKVKGEFFDVVEVKLLNGNLEALLLRKTYSPIGEMHKDMESLRDTLKERWGQYQLIDFGTITKTNAYTFRKPKSTILYHVMATQMYDRSVGVIDVNYTSKKMNAYSNKLSYDNKKQRAKALKGL